MIKIVVNSPKGGVGKTTLATNLALLMARRGKRVWALDLAQGLQMSRDLAARSEFDPAGPNKIEHMEAEELPLNFPGAANFDYLVVDTDDYFKIPASIIDPDRVGWRMLCPIVAHDPKGVRRIKEELRVVLSGALLAGQTVKLRVVANNHAAGDGAAARALVHGEFDAIGLGSVVAQATVPHSSEPDPVFLDDGDFESGITAALAELGEVL